VTHPEGKSLFLPHLEEKGEPGLLLRVALPYYLTRFSGSKIMAYSKGSLVLSEANRDDVPALAAMFPRAYHNTEIFKKMMPDTRATDKWWQDSHRVALQDPQTRFVKVTDEESREIVAMARWILPRANDGGSQPGSEEDRWPGFPDDFDHELAGALFESVERGRLEHMKDRKHYCKSR
jgi:hypothetical protein